MSPALPAGSTVDSWAPLLRLVPRAEVVAGADVAKLRQNTLWAEEIDRLRSSGDAELVATLAAAKTCGLDVRDVRRVVFAGNLGSEPGKLVALESPRIGERGTLDCLVQATKAEAEWKGATLVIEGGDEHVIPQSADVVVIVQRAWVPRIEAAAATGRAVPDPEVGVLLDRTDLGAGAWVVGSVPGGGGPPFDHVRSFAVTLDTTHGLRVAAWMGIDPGHVDAVQKQLVTQFESFSSLLPQFGVPDSIVRSVTFSNVGDGVVVHASASEADLRVTIEKIREAI
jgi:hypothetical protein